MKTTRKDGRKYYPHRYKHGKVTELMSFKTFEKRLNAAKYPKKYQKALIVLLYWTGLRINELLERTEQDFDIRESEGFIALTAPAKKSGVRPRPLLLPLDLPYINLVVERVILVRNKRRRKGKKLKLIFPCHARTARRIVKLVFGDEYYPHFFRLNRATKFLNDPSTTIPQMRNWFGWKSTKPLIEAYLGHSKRMMMEQAQRLHNDYENE